MPGLYRKRMERKIASVALCVVCIWPAPDKYCAHLCPSPNISHICATRALLQVLAALLGASNSDRPSSRVQLQMWRWLVPRQGLCVFPAQLLLAKWSSTETQPLHSTVQVTAILEREHKAYMEVEREIAVRYSFENNTGGTCNKYLPCTTAYKNFTCPSQMTRSCCHCTARDLVRRCHSLWRMRPTLRRCLSLRTHMLAHTSRLICEGGGWRSCRRPIQGEQGGPRTPRKPVQNSLYYFL